MTTDVQKVDNKKLAKKPLVNLDPETYAAAVFEPFNTRLQAAIASTAGIKYDVTTKEGMAVAKECRATFKNIRIEGEAERKARKAPILQIGKLLDAKYQAIEAEVAPHEEKFDADIKAEEARLEEIKAEKIRQEAEAAAAVQNRIDAIKNKPIELMNATPEDLQAAITELEQTVPAPADFDERYIEAEYAIKATVDTLKSILQGKLAQAKLDAQAAAQRIEQQRIDAIKAKIAAIKNTFMDAAELETSAELRALLEKMPNEINPEEYQEFATEAQDALNSMYKTINRMIVAMESAERIAADVVAENVAANQEATVETLKQAVTNGNGVAQVVLQNEVLEIKPIEAVELYANSTAPSQRIIRTQQPTAESLVKIVAAACYVSAAEAHAWLVSTDFSTYQPLPEVAIAA